MQLKIFTARPGCEEEIEKAVEDYLNGHPGTYIQSQSVAVSEYRTVLSVYFDNATLYFQNPNPDPGFTQPYFGPFGPIITCDKKEEDPWHGEFIPIGDPPMRQVRCQTAHTTGETVKQ